jgi:restriction endonuclease S subunit
LGSIAKTYFGIQAFDKGSSVSDQKENELYKPMIDGKNVFAFSESTPNSFFDFRSENIKSGGDVSIYNQDRIVIRQIGMVPIVGFCGSGVLTSNTIYNVVLNSKSYNLRYLLLILNSKFIKHYWISKFADNKKLFPKIKGFQLKKLPIPIIPLVQQEEFARKAQQIIDFNNNLKIMPSKTDKYGLMQSQVEKLKREVDHEVYKLYSLTPEEIEVIER